MNHHKHFPTGWRVMVPCIMAMSVLVGAKAQSLNQTTNAPALAPRSIFLQPASPKEGRDPFFPSSQRPYTSAVVPTTSTKDLSMLMLQGMSGSPTHRLVIINNVTFAVGDDAEVITSQGRIRIRCVQITGNAVMIEANGERHELHYGLKP